MSEKAKSTNALYYRARYYDPATGRFLGEDPLRFEGGGSDFYGYARENPVVFRDPSGLAECVYSIAQHTMTCTENAIPPVGPRWQRQLGPEGVSSGADKGTQKCKDNPACSGTKDLGPINPGRYKMNEDQRPEHRGWGMYRLEPWPHHVYDGLLYDLGFARGGFELHIGSVTFGCINADKTNPQSVDQYHDLQKMLQFENGSNFLTVTP